MWTTHILADIPIKSCPHGIVDNIGFIHIEFSNVFPSTACTRFHASFPVVFLRFSQRISGLFSMGRPSRARAVHVSREAPVRTFARNTADRIAAVLWAPPSPVLPACDPATPMGRSSFALLDRRARPYDLRMILFLSCWRSSQMRRSSFILFSTTLRLFRTVEWSRPPNSAPMAGVVISHRLFAR